LVVDAKRNRVTILPPDINASQYRFMPVGPTEVRYGLGGVKGSGESAILNILKARQERTFTDLFDFCARVDKRVVNRRTIEALVRAGAFDSVEGGAESRASLLASVGIAMEAAEQAEASRSQSGLFGSLDDTATTRQTLQKAAVWTERQRLLEEKAALGFFLTGHLFAPYSTEVRRMVKRSLAELEPSREPQWIAGIISSLRTQMTKRGKMLVVVLDDGDYGVQRNIRDAPRALKGR
jgi:DNA polymerase III subunit alpha